LRLLPDDLSISTRRYLRHVYAVKKRLLQQPAAAGSIFSARPEETYGVIIKSGFNIPPYPAGVASLLQDLEKQNPKAKGARARAEDFAGSRLVRELDQSGSIKSLLAAP
jgi:hypothetical protein